MDQQAVVFVIVCVVCFFLLVYAYIVTTAFKQRGRALLIAQDDLRQAEGKVDRWRDESATWKYRYELAKKQLEAEELEEAEEYVRESLGVPKEDT